VWDIATPAESRGGRLCLAHLASSRSCRRGFPHLSSRDLDFRFGDPPAPTSRRADFQNRNTRPEYGKFPVLRRMQSPHLAVETPEHQGGVGSAEAEGIGQRNID